MTGTSDFVDIEATLRHETDKHRQLDFGEARSVWFPIALVKDNGDDTFAMPEWLAPERGMI